MFPFFAHLFAMKWWDQCHELSFLNVEFEASYFTVLFPLDHKALYFLFAFCLYIVFQSLNRVLLFADCSTPDFAVLHHHLEFAQTHIHWVGDAIQHLILCHPLLLLPSTFPSIQVFSSESALCIKWTKYQSFSFSISPSNDYSELISFKIDWFDLCAIQGMLRGPLQYHSSKALILCHLILSTVQLSQLHMTTGKTIALTIQTFVCRAVSLL